MPNVDSRTVILLAGVMSSFMALVMFSLNRSYPSTIKGLREWGVALLLVALGSTLAFGLGYLPDAVAITMPQILFPSGLFLTYVGAQLFFGETPRYLPWAALIFVTVAVQMWCTFVTPDYAMRLRLSAALLVCLFVPFIRLVHRQGLSSFARLLTVGVLVSMCAIVAVRLLSALIWPVGADMYDTTPQQLVFLSALSVFILLLSVGMALLAAERVHTEIANLASRSAQLTEVARLALQQKNEFLATASHDLRQPLHALNLNVEALRQSNPDRRAMVFIQDIQTCASNLTQMFNSILDLSKLEAGGGVIEKRPMNLNLFLTDMSRLFAAEARQRNLNLRLRLPRRTVTIETDENLVRHIVSNLLQNALRYTNSGGILLGLRGHQSPRIEVVDTGIGIAEEDRRHIHQPFYRGRVGFTDNVNSHGLGLAVVERCVTLLGAQHGFRSRPDHGSRFWVSFKPYSDTDEPEEIESSSKANPVQYTSALAGDCCLIVEDDPIVVRGWQSFLTPTGLDLVVTADQGQTYSLLSSGFSPDYVLCDLRLRSGDNGYAILQSVLAACPEASGAMVSGEFNAPELVDATEEGIAVLQKPVSPEALMRLLLLWRSARKSLL